LTRKRVKREGRGELPNPPLSNKKKGLWEEIGAEKVVFHSKEREDWTRVTW